jgi:hypothetical protein
VKMRVKLISYSSILLIAKRVSKFLTQTASRVLAGRFMGRNYNLLPAPASLASTGWRLSDNAQSLLADFSCRSPRRRERVDLFQLVSIVCFKIQSSSNVRDASGDGPNRQML